jgi:hypothetical protein
VTTGRAMHALGVGPRGLRSAYRDVLPDEQGAACATFVLRAGEFFAAHGYPPPGRVMTDDAFPYRNSRDFRAALGVLGAEHRPVRHTVPRPTARSKGSLASCSTNGLT